MKKELLSPDMKMAEVMNRDFSLSGVLERVGLSFGFGDETVDEVCRRGGVNAETFLLICNVYLDESYTPSREVLEKVDLRDVLRYLRLSHSYYQDTVVKSLRAALDVLMEPCGDTHKMIISRFFSDYTDELSKHFEYEETVVFPYVEAMLDDSADEDFSIGQYEYQHSDVQEKLDDLKKLIMTYLPAQCEQQLIQRALSELFTLETDLHKHTIIEDNILIPAVNRLEDIESAEPAAEEDTSDALSAREKEILVGVDQGLLNKEIAAKYNISIHTVITHRKNISRKTGIKTIAGLTAYAILNNLVEL
ncbi:MAG: hemerythrin domain-containing protein [Bacteroidales bacterium]|nr:hemerythrin domain-containing protein [Bacteroidales bacterium]